MKNSLSIFERCVVPVFLTVVLFSGNDKHSKVILSVVIIIPLLNRFNYTVVGL